MKRKPIIFGIIGVVIAVALFAIYYLYFGGTVPAGQQPLAYLKDSNIESLKQSFNEAKDSVRVAVMLSPT